MIISKDRNPKLSLHYIGFLILKILKEKKSIDIEDLYKLILKEIDIDMHIDFLYYSLDWLFLTSSITLNHTEVQLCILKD